MAKVAKKSASSSKKSATTKKEVAKKADKQKKAPAKAASAASKKNATVKPVKKAAPAKKAVAKKAVAKKTAKPAVAKKTVKPAVKKAVAKTKAPVAKKAVSKPAAKKAVAPVAKKAVPAAKAKVAPVAKKPVEKTVPKKVEATKVATPKPKTVETKTPVVAPPVSAPAAGKPRRKKKNEDDDDDDEEVVVFRKPAKPTKTASKKLSSKYVSEELTMEGPAPKRVGQINMTSDEKIKLKKSLLNKCIDIQKHTVSIAKKAMEEALASANAEKVTEELSDSFRESMHATRDMYARQANEGINNLGLLNRINVVEHDKVKFGSVVFTNFQNYFISTGIGELKIDDMSFQAISTLAPLFQILVDKKKGDTFMFLDRLYTVIEVF